MRPCLMVMPWVWACVVSAQPAPPSDADPALPETVVTGSLWAMPVGEATLSASVFENPRDRTPGAAHWGDLLPGIPNLTATGGTSRPRYFQVRGVGETSQFAGETPDASVRFLMDDLDLTGLGGVATLFDTQAVEVLRGPQAGAYGANASAGLIQLRTHTPTAEWQLTAEGALGTDDLREAGVAGGGPLGGKESNLQMRLSAWRHQSDGFHENPFLNRKDTNARDEWVARLRLAYQASPRWRWDAQVLFADQDNGYDVFNLDDAEYQTFTDEPGRDAQETLAASVRAEWDAHPGWTLTSVTRATRADTVYAFDADWTDASDPRSYSGFRETQRLREMASQELRIDGEGRGDGWFPERWTIGLYAHGLQEDSAVNYADDFTAVQVDSFYESTGFAGFAQARWPLGEKTALVGGLRGEWHEVSIDAAGESLGLPVSGVSQSSEWLWGAAWSLEHRPAPPWLLFARLDRGYRTGGANVAGFTRPGDPLAYETETLWNVETGLRWQSTDGQIAARLNAFALHRDDVQLRDSDGVGGLFRFLTVNGDTARHVGLEAEGTWRPGPLWRFDGSIGLLDAHRDAYTTPTDPPVEVEERDLAAAPPFQYRLAASYGVAGRDGVFGSAVWSGRAPFFASNSHDEKRDGFARLDASLGYRWGRWELRGFVRNAFDERYAQRVFFFANEAPAFDTPRRYEALSDPRQWGVRLRYAY